MSSILPCSDSRAISSSHLQLEWKIGLPGPTQEETCIPHPAENYTLETITVTAYTNEDSDAAGTDNHQSSKAPAINGNIALTTITEGKEYTFVMPACNVKVHATFADATGIHGTVNRQSSDGKYFDLQGRPVSHPVKGLYIVNGEKVVIK